MYIIASDLIFRRYHVLINDNNENKWFSKPKRYYLNAIKHLFHKATREASNHNDLKSFPKVESIIVQLQHLIKDLSFEKQQRLSGFCNTWGLKSSDDTLFTQGKVIKWPELGSPLLILQNVISKSVLYNNLSKK